MSAIEKKIETEVKPLTSGQLYHADIKTQMSVADRGTAFAILKAILDKAEKRKEALRVQLIEDVKSLGVKDPEKNNIKLKTDGVGLRVDMRQGHVPEQEGLALLLEKAGLSMDDVSDKVIVQQFNASKLNHYIAIGKIKEEDVKALCKVTPALFAEPTEALQQLITEAFKYMEPPVLNEGEGQQALPAETPKKTKKAKASKAAQP